MLKKFTRIHFCRRSGCATMDRMREGRSRGYGIFWKNFEIAKTKKKLTDQITFCTWEQPEERWILLKIKKMVKIINLLMFLI